MDEAEKSLKFYDNICNTMPSIGFISRKKRVYAYLDVTKKVQKLVDDQEISEDNALFLLSVLVRKHSPFQKATMMAALNLASIDRKLIKPIGFKYANDFRCSLKMMPVDDVKPS